MKQEFNDIVYYVPTNMDIRYGMKFYLGNDKEPYNVERHSYFEFGEFINKINARTIFCNYLTHDEIVSLGFKAIDAAMPHHYEYKYKDKIFTMGRMLNINQIVDKQAIPGTNLTTSIYICENIDSNPVRYYGTCRNRVNLIEIINNVILKGNKI